MESRRNFVRGSNDWTLRKIMTHKSRGLFRQPFPMSTSRSAARLFVKINSVFFRFGPCSSLFLLQIKSSSCCNIGKDLKACSVRKSDHCYLSRGDPNQLEVYHRCFYDVITYNLFVFCFCGALFPPAKGRSFQIKTRVHLRVPGPCWKPLPETHLFSIRPSPKPHLSTNSSTTKDPKITTAKPASPNGRKKSMAFAAVRRESLEDGTPI